MQNAVVLLLCGLVAYGDALCQQVCTPVCAGAATGGGALIGDVPGAIVGGALSSECSNACHYVCGLGKRDLKVWREGVFPSRVADYDTNGDGQISLKEFAAGFHGRHEDVATRHLFLRVDTDADGFISAHELHSGPLRFV